MTKSVRVIMGAALALAASTAAHAHETAQEAANKKLVLDFYAALENRDAAGGMAKIAERYIAPGYIQHQEGGANGREAFAQMMSRPRTGAPAPGGAAPPRAPMAPAKLISIMAEGDKVVQVTSRDVPDPATGGTKPAFIWNMFRVENGQLAEHWDYLPTSIRPAPPAK